MTAAKCVQLWGLVGTQPALAVQYAALPVSCGGGCKAGPHRCILDVHPVPDVEEMDHRFNKYVTFDTGDAGAVHALANSKKRWLAYYFFAREVYDEHFASIP